MISVWVPARPAEAEDRLTRIVALGDSLTAGYGLPALAAFPVQLEHALRAKGYSVTVANAGVTGGHGCDGSCQIKSIDSRQH